MVYSMEIDSNGNIVKEYDVDEYGNINISYIDEALKDVDEYNLFRNLICHFKLQLTINKELYEKGKISKKLYEKVENIILERMQPLSAIMEV